MPKISLTKKYSLRISRQLSIKGPGIHGHNFYLEISLWGEAHPDSGMIFKREDLDIWVEKNILKKYDKTFLNKYFENPTTEIFAQSIFEAFKKSSWGLRLKELKIREDSQNAFVIRN